MEESQKPKITAEDLQKDSASSFTHDDFWFFEDSLNRQHKDPFREGYEAGKRDFARNIFDTFKSYEVPLQMKEFLESMLSPVDCPRWK